MDNLTCSFSGHRQIYISHQRILPKILSETIDSLIDSGVKNFQSGGAVGFDLLAARLVMEKKASGIDCKLSMILPCREQAARWPYSARCEYNNILSLADEVVYISEKYSRFCMHERNRRLVDTSQILLCYLAHDHGGTAHTVNYAVERSKQIINIASLL